MCFLKPFHLYFIGVSVGHLENEGQEENSGSFHFFKLIYIFAGLLSFKITRQIFVKSQFHKLNFKQFKNLMFGPNKTQKLRKSW